MRKILELYYGRRPKKNLSGNGWKGTVIAEMYPEEDVFSNSSQKDEMITLVKRKEINNLFEKELKQYGKYVSGLSKDVSLKTHLAINQICSLNYKTVSFELTPDQSGIFHLKYDETNELLIERKKHFLHYMKIKNAFLMA
jgi:hypothetical protein